MDAASSVGSVGSLNMDDLEEALTATEHPIWEDPMHTMEGIRRTASRGNLVEGSGSSLRRVTGWAEGRGAQKGGHAASNYTPKTLVEPGEQSAGGGAKRRPDNHNLHPRTISRTLRYPIPCGKLVGYGTPRRAPPMCCLLPPFQTALGGWFCMCGKEIIS
jgi:hypothetical protein